MDSDYPRFTERWISRVDSFNSLDLKPRLLQNVYNQTYSKPTNLQARSILSILKLKDTIAISEGWSGKTSSLIISTLQLVDQHITHCQALILAPIRETSSEIYDKILQLAEGMGISVKLLKAEKANKTDLSDFQIIVGTSQQIYDMIDRGLLDVGYLKLVGCDGIDEILEREVEGQIREMLSTIKKDNEYVQIVFCTGQKLKKIAKLADEFMDSPAIISETCYELTLEGIRQHYIDVLKEEYKLFVLLDLFDTLSISQCIIFCNTKQKVQELAQKMTDMCFTVSFIHEDIGRLKLDESLEDFRTGASRVMITTDIFTVGRRYHPNDSSLLINYDVALSMVKYLLRIGRGGAFGRKGFAINLITQADYDYLKGIETYFNTEITELTNDAIINYF